MKVADILSLIIAFAAFGLILFWPQIRASFRIPTQLKARIQPEDTRIGHYKQTHRHLWRAIKWTIETLAAVLALASTVSFFWGIPWPVAPEILHRGSSFSSQNLTTEFTIKNRGFFDMDDVELACGFDLIYMRDALGNQIIFKDGAFTTGVPEPIKARSAPFVYDCDASKLIRIDREFGTITRSGNITSPPDKPFTPPLTVWKICIWVGGTYEKFFHRWWFTSTIAQWEKGSDQWVEGGAITNPPQEPPPPISIWEPAFGFSYGRGIFKAPGIFADDALTCGRDARFPFMLYGGKKVLDFIFPDWQTTDAVQAHMDELLFIRDHPAALAPADRYP